MGPSRDSGTGRAHGAPLCLWPLVSRASQLLALAQGVAAAGLLRCWALLRAPDLLFMAAFAAACIGMLLWRAVSPTTFASWRELPAAALRLALAAPTPYKIVCNTLGGVLPFSGGGQTVWDALLFLLALLFAGCGAAGTGTVRGSRLAFQSCRIRPCRCSARLVPQLRPWHGGMLPLPVPLSFSAASSPVPRRPWPARCAFCCTPRCRH